jgi:tripartite-type tricarboxylate transporter receptor subunit TctC
MNKQFSISMCLVAVAVSTLYAGNAAAQEFPSKPLRIIVPYPGATGPDLVTRGLASGMSKLLGQNVLVENKQGGGGVPAILDMKNAPADGHTMFMSDNGHWAAFPALRSDLPYDPLRDFAPISLMYKNGLFFFVSSGSPLKTMSDLIARAKEKPGALKFGVTGVDGIMRFVGEAFRVSAGIDTLAVPYRASNESVTAVLGGDLDYAVAGLSSLRALSQAGRLRILANAAARRDRYVPEAPTVSESANLKDFNFSAEIGLVANAATPKPIIDRLARAVADAQRDAPYLEALRKLEYDVNTSTPEEFGARIRGDLERFRAIARVANIKVQ